MFAAAKPTYPRYLRSAPTIAKSHCHWNAFPPLASDGLILAFWRRLKAHSANFVVIQIHLSRRFYLAIDFLGLRRRGSWSQIIDQAQDVDE